MDLGMELLMAGPWVGLMGQRSATALELPSVAESWPE